MKDRGVRDLLVIELDGPITKLGTNQGFSEARGEGMCTLVSASPARTCLGGVRGRDLRGPGSGSSALSLGDTAVPGESRTGAGANC